MSSSEVARRRIRAQHLDTIDLRRPRDVVSWLGAVQAQDYLGALWAVGLRLAPAAQATEALVEAALADRSIVRSWPMRGTLHFVAAEDLRWLLVLLGPRVVARAARRHAELGLDAATFTRSRTLLEKALEGGRCLTRAEIYRVLTQGKVSPAGQRGIHLIQRLALDGVLCFGARQGKQQTFALLEEWLAPAPGLAGAESRARSREESLFELARRYFTGHGPATLADFTWFQGVSSTSDSKWDDFDQEPGKEPQVPGTMAYAQQGAPQAPALPARAPTRSGTQPAVSVAGAPAKPATAAAAPKPAGGTPPPDDDFQIERF